MVSGYPTSTNLPRVDRLSTDPRDLGRHIYDTGSMYSFESTVLRVLLQLESPKSEHRNSRYVLRASPARLSKIATQNILKYCIIYFN